MAGRPSVVPAHVYNPGLYARAAPALGLGASGHPSSLGGTTGFGAPAASRATGPVGAPPGGPYGNPALGAQPMPAGHGAVRASYTPLAGAPVAYTGMRATRGVGKPAGYWAGTSGGRRKSRRHRKKSRKTRRRH